MPWVMVIIMSSFASRTNREDCKNAEAFNSRFITNFPSSKDVHIQIDQVFFSGCLQKQYLHRERPSACMQATAQCPSSTIDLLSLVGASKKLLLHMAVMQDALWLAAPSEISALQL